MTVVAILTILVQWMVCTPSGSVTEAFGPQHLYSSYSRTGARGSNSRAFTALHYYGPWPGSPQQQQHHMMMTMFAVPNASPMAAAPPPLQDMPPNMENMWHMSSNRPPQPPHRPPPPPHPVAGGDNTLVNHNYSSSPGPRGTVTQPGHHPEMMPPGNNNNIGVHVNQQTMAASYWEPAPQPHHRMDYPRNNERTNRQANAAAGVARGSPNTYLDPREHAQFVGSTMMTAPQPSRVAGIQAPPPYDDYVVNRRGASGYHHQHNSRAPPPPSSSYSQPRRQQQQEQPQHQWPGNNDVYQQSRPYDGERGSSYEQRPSYREQRKYPRRPSANPSRARAYTLEKNYGEPLEDMSRQERDSPSTTGNSRARGDTEPSVSSGWKQNMRTADDYTPESFTTVPMGPKQSKKKKKGPQKPVEPMGPNFDDEPPRNVVVDVLPKTPPDSVFSYSVRQPDDLRPPKARQGQAPRQPENPANHGWGVPNNGQQPPNDFFGRNPRNGFHPPPGAAGPQNNGAFRGPPPRQHQPQASFATRVNRPKPRTRLYNPNHDNQNVPPPPPPTSPGNTHRGQRSASFYDPSRDFGTQPPVDDSPSSGGTAGASHYAGTGSSKSKFPSSPVGSFFNDKENVQPRETIVGPTRRDTSSPARAESPVSGASRIYKSFTNNSDRLGKPMGSCFDGGKNEQPRETIVGPGASPFRRNGATTPANAGRTQATPNQPGSSPRESSPPTPKTAAVNAAMPTEPQTQASTPPSPPKIVKEEAVSVTPTNDSMNGSTEVQQNEKEGDKPRVFIATASDSEIALEKGPASPDASSEASPFSASSDFSPPTESQSVNVDNTQSAYEKQLQAFSGAKEEPAVIEVTSFSLPNPGEAASTFFDIKEEPPVVSTQVPSSPLPDLGAAVSNLQGTMSAYEQQLQSYFSNVKDSVDGNGTKEASESVAFERNAPSPLISSETEKSFADTSSNTLTEDRGIQDFYSGGPPRR